MSEPENITEQISQAHEQISKIKHQLNALVIGQETVIDSTLVSLLAGGHILIEGVPGLGKTMLVRSLAKSFAGRFSRIQFTPDLMPSDITGHSLFDMQSQTFKVRKGPVFTNLLLADEINRAPAKTQAALLEVMQEQQVTIDSKPFSVGAPFMVLATQNPIEQEGTYPLPEAELDRFMMKVFIDYPKFEDEVSLLKALNQTDKASKDYLESVEAVIDSHQLLALRRLACQIAVDEKVMEYAVKLVSATRDWGGIVKGAGPRGSINLINAAKAHALMNNQSYVTPDDIKHVAMPVLRHRLILSADREIEGITADHLIGDILGKVDVPRQ